MQRMLTYAWYNAVGKDVSDVMRGKIQMLDEILEQKGLFERFDKLEQSVKEAQKIGKGAN